MVPFLPYSVNLLFSAFCFFFIGRNHFQDLCCIFRILRYQLFDLLLCFFRVVGIEFHLLSELLSAQDHSMPYLDHFFGI